MTAARFQVGERVRIDDRFEARHHRTPAYVKGREGVVERVCQAHGRPEVLGYEDRDDVALPVYRVRLWQRDLWPRYDGRGDDTLEIEIFEHWLKPAGQGEPQR